MRRPSRSSILTNTMFGGRAHKIGAFEAMGEGTVDLNWAKEHHRLWVEEQLARATNETRGQPTATLKE
jgi:cytochrome b subunit of formate dehydrogenase